MRYKIVSTTLLVVIAVALLVNLAFRVRTGESGDPGGRSQYVSKGCCANKGGGCAADKAKGE
ncbi:MAG: hypothetical protein HXX17_01750 [Geobacteraceae bacterium]|nr:hypothetical protein [Geobacteraceae bacterium]